MTQADLTAEAINVKARMNAVVKLMEAHEYKLISTDDLILLKLKMDAIADAVSGLDKFEMTQVYAITWSNRLLEILRARNWK